MTDEAARDAVVHASDHLRVVFRAAEGGSDRPLVVTFDSLSLDLRLDRPGFGEVWLRQVGYDAVHVVSDRNGWYQSPEMARVFPRVREIARERARTVTYGSSMGGYAAVRFAGRVGAQAAVAISPQFSIDPRKTPFEDRWTEYAAGLSFSWEAPSPEDAALERAYVLYDPADRDRLHMERLAEVFPVTPVPLLHAGHPAGTFLAEGLLLPDAVRAMIDGRFDPGEFRRARREARRRSGQYHHVLASRLPARRRATAERLGARAVELQPRSAVYLSALADRREDAGDLAGAEEAHRRALGLDPLEPRLYLRLAEFLLRRGAPPAEVVELAAGIGRFGAQRTPVYTKACEVLLRAGAYEAARDELRAALERLPASRKLRSWEAALSATLSTPVLGRRLLDALRVRLTRSAALRRG